MRHPRYRGIGRTFDLYPAGSDAIDTYFGSEGFGHGLSEHVQGSF